MYVSPTPGMKIHQHDVSCTSVLTEKCHPYLLKDLGCGVGEWVRGWVGGRGVGMVSTGTVFRCVVQCMYG